MSDNQGLYVDTGLIHTLKHCSNFCISDSIIALVPREGSPLDAELGGMLGRLTDECPQFDILEAVFGGMNYE